MTPILIKNYVAAAAVPAYTIARMNVGGAVARAAAATDAILGITSEIDAEAGGRCDVILAGIAPVIYGATVTAGALLTADASGRAIATTTANDRYIGIALVDGVVGDRGSCLVSQGVV